MVLEPVVRIYAVDKALRYLASSKVSPLHSLMESSQLYTLKDEEIGD